MVSSAVIDYVLIVVVSLLSCAGQLSQKQAACGQHTGSHHRHILLWMGISILLLGLAMLLWLVVLQRVPVGIAYPMLSLNFILVALAAHVLWREAISWRQIVGIVFIVAGIVLMGGNA
ncbi:4-amino-4-deoxy-L-arabinose-phosphoundecaprenol flippase subunit ArnE [Pectobacteriaceae bacterium CE70]|uniref:4-amino-4-deoxy-L-arabinose-phospho-UDP flippase n=1 Tax=Serratia sp. (strain ATCC 39006) TaxID=104623 RepID=A0A2I5T2P1_SERS3|nr:MULTISPECIES: 4-amino-4-deoxy-L-arabinose-phosphoundecaprenol flippase subunit ArnE [Enterobacterales]AUG98847.1 4-amino-4-deoxy-L-arabinose-phospho-UDP flippase [Serratia sp. ATCC 39006]AUH03162.1 4-amino-4-deoxy-L-arabinose-phospho-UDP flippase [Serratia sp. ATCC 39006]WJV66849.1 4-amino-4-deoxy-L-arabinose-phosphoundecaprenol flippase subunit ArnE [Pectobacteriaceae bacterium CE70]WJY10841.1 4-amino-4-deoxy-L-arabinose-phosphoundecaprenol flippase subunit ArnE [Pectobacteriaceae bacterium